LEELKNDSLSSYEGSSDQDDSPPRIKIIENNFSGFTPFIGKYKVQRDFPDHRKYAQTLNFGEQVLISERRMERDNKQDKKTLSKGSKGLVKPPRPLYLPQR
jgi:hypothetical protein